MSATTGGGRHAIEQRILNLEYGLQRNTSHRQSSAGYVPNLDQNSLVLGVLDRSAWTQCQLTLGPVVVPIAAVSTISGAQSLIGVNSESNCPPGGYIERPFTTPAGVTGLALELDEVQLGYGDGTTGAATIALYDSAGLNLIQSLAFMPTSVPTTVSTGTIAVQANTEYRIRIECNVVAQSRFLTARARVRPTVSTDPFWTATFQRLEVDASNMLGNTLRGYQNPRYVNQPSIAQVEFRPSNGNTTIQVEVFCNSEYYLGPGNYDAEVFVDGVPYASLAPAASQDVSYIPCVLPAATPQTVRVGAGAAATGDGLGLNLNRGTYLKAIYLPSAPLSVTQNPVKRAVILGDSKAIYYPTNPAATGCVQLLREHGWDVTCEALGGGTLDALVGTTLTVAACAAEAAILAQRNPDLILIEISRNDWIEGLYSPTNLVTQLGNLMDAIHAALPACQVGLWSYTHEETETPISGVSWDTQRQNSLALVTSRAPWAFIVDGGGLWMSSQFATYTADTVHPSQAGHSRIARDIELSAITQAFDYPFKPSDASPVAWWESDVLVAGGAMGAVTSGGSSPPVVTFTGSPSYASQLIVEIRVGGPLGTATFDASLDGGRSWPYRSVATAASVVLSAFGITVNFGAGTYNNLNTYYASSAPGNWSDMLGSGLTLVPTGALWVAPTIVGTPPGPVSEPNMRLAGGNRYAITGENIPQPYSVMVVGVLDANTALQHLLGQSAVANSAVQLYTNSTTAMAAILNGSQIPVTVDVTKIHCYSVVVNGASSIFYVDGVPTAGTLGAGAYTAQWIAADGQGGSPMAGNVSAYAIFSSALTPDLALSIASRMRAKYGTP